MLVRQVKIRSMVRPPSQVQPDGRRPSMPQALDAQRPDLGAGTVPHLLPRARVDLLNTIGLRELARVLAPGAPVALRPLPPPQPDVRLWAEAALLGRPPVERGDDVLDAVDVEYRRRPGWSAVVEGKGSLVERRADGGERRDDAGGVWPTRQEAREASAVGLSARVDAGSVDGVCG